MTVFFVVCGVSKVFVPLACGHVVFQHDFLECLAPRENKKPSQSLQIDSVWQSFSA